MSHWEALKYFNEKENWGTPSKMKISFLRKLDQARHFIGCPFIITQGTGGTHLPNSEHDRGNAADLIILSSRHPIDLLIDLSRFPFGGIGYYPHWKYQNKVVGGWHLDDRDTLKGDRPAARWMGVLDEHGSQIYVALNWENLNRYGVIRTD